MTKNIKKIIVFLYCLVFCTVIAVGMPQMVRAEEEFTGVPETKSGDLTWSISADGELKVEGEGDYKTTLIYISGYVQAPEWLKYSEYIRKANISITKITSTAYMFGNCSNLSSFDMNSFDTSDVINMSGMFRGCSGLTSLDISKFDTNNVTNMSGMFKGCSGLTSLDVSKFDTNNVTDMSYMFSDCSRLTSLNVNKFYTNNVTDMFGMFSGCSGLTSLDVSKFDTSNVTNMSYMFDYCSGLTSLDVSKFDTSNVTGMWYMFSDCSGLTSLDVSKFDTSNVTNMTSMFRICSRLTSLDVSKFDTSNVTNMREMFYACWKLTSLDVSKFDTSNVTDMYRMFCGCGSVDRLDVSKFDTSNVTIMNEMFASCNEVTNLDVSNFNTSNVTDMGYMFSDCNNLTSLDVSNFNTAEVTDMSSMFSGCSGLTSLDVSNFNTSKINSNNYFYLSDLNSLEKLYFFANSSKEYDLFFSSNYYWINDSLETVTKTAKDVDRKVNYYRLKDGEIPAIPIPIPTSTPVVPSPEPSETPSASPTQAPVPSASPVTPSDTHIFSDYDYTTPVSGSAIIYGNGMNKRINGKRINNKALTVYTDILASYKYTLSNNGTVKPSVGKVIVAVTKTADKPAVDYKKNKVTDTSASKIAKAKIKNGQITVTAVGKEGGSVYLWVIDTGTKGISASCPIDVKLAPKKLEVQSTTGTKLTNTKLQNGTILDVHISGLVGSAKTEDCTYTATVDNKYNSYVQVNSKGITGQDFTITAKGIKNNKDTKVAVTFTCDQNGKKAKFSLTITK